MASRRLRLRRIIVALAIGGVLVSACAGSGYHYVKNSDDNTYFKVPDDWKLFDEDAVIKVFGKSLSERERDTQRALTWQIAFDANAQPSVRNLLDIKAAKPTGITTVEQLAQDNADTISIEGLRNWYLPIDEALQTETGTAVLYEPIEYDGGFRGIHLVAEIDDSEGRPLTFNQISVLDQSTSRIYTLLITCNSKCYDKHATEIEKVVDSWTVEE